VIRLATVADAPVLHRLIHEAFAARPVVDPPAEALGDTVDDIAAGLASPDWGLLATVDGEPAGCLMVRRVAPADAPGRPAALLRRVSVAPPFRHHGLAGRLVRHAVCRAADEGVRRLLVMARAELPDVLAWWDRYGFALDHAVSHGYILGLDLAAPVSAPTAEAMCDLGVALAGRLRAGDLVVANGELGAGKTTLAQGIAAGLGVERPVLSPTFVLSRVHPSRSGGVAFVHADAYRLGSAAEVDDLDLDASADGAVTYVEWGAGLVEQLADSRLDVTIVRSGDPEDATRTVYLVGVGPRWAGEDLGTEDRTR